jgi:hypothetical protein
MATSTPNLSLVLYNDSTDQAVSFATFRAVWGGPATTSNFYKIDTAYGNLVTSIAGVQRGSYVVDATFDSGTLYTATVAGITSLTTNMSIILNVGTSVAGITTLNINSLGAKTLMKINSSGVLTDLASGDLRINRNYLFTYNGAEWVWVSATSADQISIVGSIGNIVTVGSNNNLSGSSSLGVIIDSFTPKTTPVGGDKLVLSDSEDSSSPKEVSLSNLYKGLGTGTQDSSTFLRGDGSYATPVEGVALTEQVVYTSNATWTKADYPALYAILVICVGGGGSGGGCTGASSQAALSGGGGGGGYSQKLIMESSLGTTETVTVGAGGTAPTAGDNPGNSGGNTSFGSHVTANGGEGGLSNTASATVPRYGSAGGSGGTATGGDVNVTGGASPRFAILFVGASGVCPSPGGSSVLGMGGVSASVGNQDGTVGNSYGGGGSGSGAVNSGTSRAGGAGANGVVIVQIYRRV